MNSRIFAIYGGMVMIAMGAISLFPGFEGNGSGLFALALEASYGDFLDLFPMNILNKLAFILFGFAGVVCGLGPARTAVDYARTVASFMGALSLLGMIPPAQTLGGLWPLYGGVAIAHGLFALVAGLCAMEDTRSYGAKP